MESQSEKPNFVGKDYSPFGGEFVKTVEGGGSGSMDVVRMKDGKLKVIRSCMLSVGNLRSLEDINQGIKRLRELEQFGFNIPSFEVVLAANQLEKNPKYKSNTKNNLYMVVDYVDGLPLAQAPEDVQNQVVESNFKYIDYCNRNNLEQIGDIRQKDQYIYGSIDGGPKMPYLVDIDLAMVPEANPVDQLRRT